MILPIPVIPKEKESLAGYLWRLSEANGYTNVDHMRRVFSKPLTLWKLMHRPYPGDDADMKLIPHLVRMTGLDADQFRQSLFFNLPSKSEAGHRFDAPLLDWRAGFARICPDCLMETGVMRREWELLPFSVCPTHNKPLIHQCPACKKEIDLHADLATHCPACMTPWADSCTAHQAVPEYQAAWLSADDPNEWLHAFGWMLLRAVRPMDLQHNGIKFYDAPASQLNTLLNAAWMLMKSGPVRDDWEAMRAFRFNTFTGLMLSHFHVKAGLPQASGVPENLVDDNEMKPRWSRLNYSSEVIGWTLDTENLIIALGLQSIIDPFKADDNQSFQALLRTEARNIIDQLGFQQIGKEKDTRRKRYDIREVNAWIEEIPLYESSEDMPEVFWVEASEPLLRIYGGCIIQLAKAIQSGQINGYRRLHMGLSCLGVERTELMHWLMSQLDAICSEPAPLHTLRVILSLSRSAILKLEAAHLLTPTKGDYRGRHYTGESVREFVLSNQQSLMKINDPE